MSKGIQNFGEMNENRKIIIVDNIEVENNIRKL
jgi:hypothetical protein